MKNILCEGDMTSFFAWVVPSDLYKQPFQVSAELYDGTNIRWKDGVSSYSYAYGADWTFSEEIAKFRLKVKRDKLITYLRLQIKQREAKIAKLMRLQ